MPGIARVGDTVVGICCHPIHDKCINVTGQIIAGSGNVIANSTPTARLGDSAISSCGHIGTVVTGSPTTKTNSRATARIGDRVVGDFSGTIVGGSGNIISK